MGALVVAVVAWGFLRRNHPAPAVVGGSNPAAVFTAYAGSDSCAECHPAAFAAWQQSHHGRAERPFNLTNDLAAFVPARDFRDGSGAGHARWTNGHAEVVTRGASNAPVTARVERVIGESPLQQFLVAAPGGRWQTLETSWDPRRHEWFNVFGNEDRRPGEWGHWTGRGMNWNSMCAGCHNTRLQKNYEAATDTYRTAMAERSVGCEACHGPMKAHAEWRRRHPGTKETDPTVKRMSAPQWLGTCGSCHARRGELTGDFVPGDAFTDHFTLATVDETDLYFPDGQVRDEDYEFASFLSSRMHAAGVQCGDCHEPHSAKTLLPGNALCLRCHSGGPSAMKAPVINPLTHTFHRADGSGSQCVNCHMPQTTYMQRHPRHDHGFTVPDPLLTQQLGVPNACNRCHTDKDTAWSLAAVEKWYGPRMNRPARQRAQTIAAARRGDEAAIGPLLALLRTNETSYWQAVAVRLLEPWIAEPPVQPAVLALAGHTNALVRAHVVRALEPLAGVGGPARATVEQMLSDPDRGVRVAAAWNLRETLALNSATGRELTAALAVSADQPLGQLRLGHFHTARGEPAKAREHFQRAVEWDPNSPPLRRELAVALSQAGETSGAIAQLEAAARLDPNEAEYRFLLALAFGEAGQRDRVVPELEAALKLNPRHARAAYNLGLARQERGDSAGALEALLRAETADPRDPRIPYARATIHAQSGQPDEARAAVRRALELQPDWPAARQLLESLVK